MRDGFGDVMSRGTKSLWPVAFHEAGHAVVSIALEVPFRAVYIRSNGEGACVGTGECQPLQRRQVEDNTVATLAGPFSEVRKTKCGIAWVGFGSPDYIAAMEMMRWLVEMGYVPSLRAAERRFVEQTRDIVTHTWGGMERVAAALVQHRELTPGAVAALAGLREASS